MAENEFEGVLKMEQTSGWLREGGQYRKITNFTDEELLRVKRIWVRGGRVTKDRVSAYIALFGETKRSCTLRCCRGCPLEERHYAQSLHPSHAYCSC